MRFASLGSGSKGNGTLVAWPQGMVLIDCGFSVKNTIARMQRLQVSPDQLTALLVTHEHSDHMKGVGALARRFQLPVYMTPGTYHSREWGELPDLQLVTANQAFEINQLTVNPVTVPHDAREPTQFVFDYKQRRLGVLTDLGSITPHVESAYANCDAMILEANHDPHMLAYGPYPPSLKRRVSGLWGHLSNAQAAGFLQRVDIERLQHLVIAHISQKNNDLERVKSEIEGVVGALPSLLYACQDEGFDWLEVDV